MIENIYERAAEYGVNSLLPSELISLLIGLDTEKVESVLEKLGGLGNLPKMEIWDIQDVPGIGPKKALKMLAIVELSTKMQKAKFNEKSAITQPEDVFNLVAEMQYYDREHFKVLLLNTKNHVIDIETVSIGTLNSSLVHPREAYKSAIKKSAASVIFAHNHPSGTPNPSHEDIKITQRLKEAGLILGIGVLDHVIVARKGFYSFKEGGHI